MGVYQYTMRKDVLEVEGMKIGRFDFAYKLGRDWEPGGMTSEYRNGKYIKNRTVLMLEAQARKAREALPEVEYMVVCKKFTDASKYNLPVYEIGRTMDQFTEELDHKRLVGNLRMEGRKFVFEPVSKI